MIPSLRNPFLIRTAEQSESDDQFLNLFSENILDILPEDGSWNRYLPILSAPRRRQVHAPEAFYPESLVQHSKLAAPTRVY